MGIVVACQSTFYGEDALVARCPGNLAHYYDGANQIAEYDVAAENLEYYYGERSEREPAATGKADMDVRVRPATCPERVSRKRASGGGPNAIAEYDASDNLSRRYIHGTTYVDERAVLIEGGTTDPDTYYYILQELYTVTGLMKKNGTLAEANTYDAYGKVAQWGYRDFDFDRDGDVDKADQSTFNAAWSGSGNATNDPMADGDFDGDSDSADSTLFSAAYTGSRRPPIFLLTSALGNPYHFTGRRLHMYEDIDAGSGRRPNKQVQFNRARHYDPHHGRWLQRDPALYVDTMNLYEYVWSRPTILSDPTGRWGEEVHDELTSDWARSAGMKPSAASQVGQDDIATDGVGTGWLPFPAGDQSRHFNRSLGGQDSRLAWRNKELKWAREQCTGRNDKPRSAARHVGRALHSVQDWWAHGDYTAGPLPTLIYHGEPYDDWEGRIVDRRTGGRAGKYWPITDPLHLLIDLPLPKEFWVSGSARNAGTEQDSRAILNQYVSFIRSSGNCKCRKYFLDRP